MWTLLNNERWRLNADRIGQLFIIIIFVYFEMKILFIIADTSGIINLNLSIISFILCFFFHFERSTDQYNLHMAMIHFWYVVFHSMCHYLTGKTIVFPNKITLNASSQKTNNLHFDLETVTFFSLFLSFSLLDRSFQILQRNLYACQDYIQVLLFAHFNPNEPTNELLYITMVAHHLTANDDVRINRL